MNKIIKIFLALVLTLSMMIEIIPVNIVHADDEGSVAETAETVESPAKDEDDKSAEEPAVPAESGAEEEGSQPVDEAGGEEENELPAEAAANAVSEEEQDLPVEKPVVLNAEAFSEEFTVGDLTVAVSYEAGTVPEETEVVVSEASEEALNAIKEKYGEEAGIFAADISFYYDGEKIEPKDYSGKKVSVVLSYNGEAKLTDTVHVKEVVGEEGEISYKVDKLDVDIVPVSDTIQVPVYEKKEITEKVNIPYEYTWKETVKKYEEHDIYGDVEVEYEEEVPVYETRDIIREHTEYVTRTREVEKTRTVKTRDSAQWHFSPWRGFRYITEKYTTTENYREPVTVSEVVGKEEVQVGTEKVKKTRIERQVIGKEKVEVGTEEVSHTETRYREEEVGTGLYELVVTGYKEETITVSQSASFEADDFSVYALVWKDADGNDCEATITWGYYDGENFAQLEEESTIVLDTTASSVSLDNTYSGYVFLTAYYISSSGERSIIEPNLTKSENGWQVKRRVYSEEGDTYTIETIDVEDNSNIHVVYSEITTPSPSGSGDETVPSPITDKNVTDNGDGTYTITLDVTGAAVTETIPVGANVLIVLDRTNSMDFSLGNSTRWAAAKSAIDTLVTTLTTGDNEGKDVQFALLDFHCYSTGSSWWNIQRHNDDVLHSWNTSNGAHQNSGTNYWSSFPTPFNNYIQSSNFTTASNTNGTNWQSPLNSALTILNARDSDKTFVIFVTDGEPNCAGIDSVYTYNDGDVVTPATNAAKVITALPNVSLYGVFCGTDSGYQTLNGVMTSAGAVSTIDGSSQTAMTQAFQNIAQDIVNSLGAQGVSVDDGVPSLSGISANVSGEAGGYKYYVKGKNDTEFAEWEDAPGAIYSSDNGVTWDLSSAGVLPEGTTYRIEFTVWPSQEAYDLIADLNNGLKNYDDLSDAEKAAVTGSKEEGYTLVTNTHLNTKYVFKDHEYSDPKTDYQYKSMPLPTETVSIEKKWPQNMIDSYGAAVYRDPVTGETKTATEIELTLQRDNADYLNVKVLASKGWKEDEIYISCGNMTVKDGVATIHEPGHDYQIVEPPEFLYYWDLISDVYHPMVINGTKTLLILDVDATSDDVDNVTYFNIGGKIYKKSSNNESILEASNYRRSNLNLSKQVFNYDGTAITDENAVFTYKAKVTDSYSTDDYVWFSAWDSAAGGLVKEAWATGEGVTAELGTDGQPNGYFYAPNGTELTLKIKAGWNVRFLNIYHDSTFSFEETGMPNNYKFDSVAASTQYEFVHTSSADWYEKVSESTTGKITGTITEPNNNYTITYSNKTKPEFYIYHSGVAGDGNLETISMDDVNADGEYNLYAKTTSGFLYGGYYLDYAGKGDYKDDGVPGTTGVAYTGMNYEWSKDEAQTVDGRNMKPQAGETYYIKEVPTYYLRNYHQINYVKSTGKLTGFYLISAVDDLNYKESGMFLVTEDQQKAKIVNSLSFQNASTGKVVTLKADVVFNSLGITEEGEYLSYIDLTNTEYFAVGNFTVLPYWVTPDGINVEGVSTRTITITEMTKSGVTKTDN